MVDRLEREALVEYQLAIQAMLAGFAIAPVSVDEARDRFDRHLLGEPAVAVQPAPMDDRTRLHRILGVA